MQCYMRIIFFVLPLVLLRIELGYSIQCYVCSSHKHEDCEKITDERYLTNCSEQQQGPKYLACRKMDQWIDFSVAGQSSAKRVIRQCASNYEASRSCYYKAGFGGRVNVCDCSEDKCNAASLPFVPFGLIIISLIVGCRLFW